MRLKRVVVCAAAATTAVLLSSCSPSTAPSVDLDDQLIMAADAAAAEIVGDQELSGTVTILGALGGDQLDQYLAAFKPFEEASGIKVEYEGTRDMLSVLETRVQGGNPPDVVSNPSIGQMKRMMQEGALVDLSAILDMDAVSRDYDAGLIDLGSSDGKLYGLMATAALKGLVYYNPQAFDGPTDAADWAALQEWATTEAEGGTTPWCIGVESGAASGWPATDWIEQFMLTGNDLEIWDAWAGGELEWTSPEVREAFEAFGAVATDPSMVNGGPTAVASTDFIQGALPLWASPSRCSLTLQADWLGSTVVAQVPDTEEGTDVDFFLFPPVDEANTGRIETAGEMLGAFNDTPEVRAFLEYAATPESQALIASTGSWLSANRSVVAEAYPTEARQQAAQIMSGATAVRFDASDLMPQAVNEAFWRATLMYISDPSKLDEALQSVEDARLATAN